MLPSSKQITAAQYLTEIRALLRGYGVDNAAGEARQMLAHLLQCESATFLSVTDILLSADQIAILQQWTKRRGRGEPLQYIIGETGFWTLKLKCCPRVLIPRADSEAIIRLAQRLITEDASGWVADLGVGSGALLLAFLQERPRFFGLAIDKNAAALHLTRENAIDCGMQDKIKWLQSDWSHAIAKNSIDLILCNPPYINPALRPQLQSELGFEPDAALFANENGLAAYPQIFEGARNCFTNEGYIIVEIGQGQREDVIEIAKYFQFRLVDEEKDLASIPRALAFQVSGPAGPTH